MEEKLSDTMVKIQQAALEEFSDKGFPVSYTHLTLPTICSV